VGREGTDVGGRKKRPQKVRRGERREEANMEVCALAHTRNCSGPSRRNGERGTRGIKEEIIVEERGKKLRQP